MTYTMSDLQETARSNPDFARVNADVLNPASEPLTGGKKGMESQMGRLPSGESEKDFATWFEGYLHLKGYKFAHFRPARVMRNGKEIYETPVSGDAAGLEDYFVWHEVKRVYFWAELKSEKGSLSGKQKIIIASHRAAGLTVFVWHPCDRESIEKELT